MIDLPLFIWGTATVGMFVCCVCIPEGVHPHATASSVRGFVICYAFVREQACTHQLGVAAMSTRGARVTPAEKEIARDHEPRTEGFRRHDTRHHRKFKIGLGAKS